jgi:hypothetical protein
MGGSADVQVAGTVHVTSIRAGHDPDQHRAVDGRTKGVAALPVWLGVASVEPCVGRHDLAELGLLSAPLAVYRPVHVRTLAVADGFSPEPDNHRLAMERACTKSGSAAIPFPANAFNAVAVPDADARGPNSESADIIWHVHAVVWRWLRLDNGGWDGRRL